MRRGSSGILHQCWGNRLRHTQFGVADSSVTLISVDPRMGSSLNSVGYLGNKRYVGWTLSGADGFYIENSMAFDKADASPGAVQNRFPAIWLCDVAGRLAYCPPCENSGLFSELDLFEAYPISAGGIQPRFCVFDLTVTSTCPYGINVINPNYIANLGNPYYPNFNTFGTLVVPMARNNGTGYIHRYFNRNHLTAQDVTWKRGGNWSSVEKANYMLMLRGGYNWPVSFGYVAIWGRSDASIQSHNGAP